MLDIDIDSDAWDVNDRMRAWECKRCGDGGVAFASQMERVKREHIRDCPASWDDDDEDEEGVIPFA